MPEFLFLGIEIADSVALFHGASCTDGAGRGEQRFGKCCLACCAVADKRYGTKIGGSVLTHVISH